MSSLPGGTTNKKLLEEDLEEVDKRLKSNKSILNTEKTQTLCFGRNETPVLFSMESLSKKEQAINNLHRWLIQN